MYQIQLRSLAVEKRSTGQTLSTSHSCQASLKITHYYHYYYLLWISELTDLISMVFTPQGQPMKQQSELEFS